MKAIQCDNCGSIDLEKIDGLWTCAACGTRFERGTGHLGKVSIDHSEEIQTLYRAARRAKELGNYDGAQKSFDKILEKNPDSWEAIFNTVYMRLLQCKVGEIDHWATKMSSVMPAIIQSVHDEYDRNEQESALQSIYASLVTIHDLFGDAALSMLSTRMNGASRMAGVGTIGSLLEASDMKSEANTEFKMSMAKCASMFEALADSIWEIYTSELKEDCVAKTIAIEALESANVIFDGHGFTTAARKVADKARAIDPSYKSDSEIKEEAKEAVAEEKRKAKDEKNNIRWLFLAVSIIMMIPGALFINAANIASNGIPAMYGFGAMAAEVGLLLSIVCAATRNKTLGYAGAALCAIGAVLCIVGGMSDTHPGSYLPLYYTFPCAVAALVSGGCGLVVKPKKK